MPTKDYSTKPPVQRDPVQVRPRDYDSPSMLQSAMANMSMDDSMAGYLFEQQMKGNLTKEEVDGVYDQHAENMKIGTMGAGAAAVSASADIMALATAIGYNAYNVARGGRWAWPENMRNVPATSDWWGAQLGLSEAQTDSLAFIGGGLAIAPSRSLDALDQKTMSAAIRTAKALGGGTRQAAVARRIEAEKLFKEGGDVDKIWQETGWWPHKDDAGKINWKFYISDADAKFNYDAVAKEAALRAKQVGLSKDGDRIQVPMRMSDVLDHPALYELYPEIAGYPISVWMVKTPEGWEIPWNKGETLADWNPQTRKFRLHSAQAGAAVNPQDAVLASVRESLLHEAQHAIQTLEGWADGANSRVMKDAVSQFKAGRFMSSVYKNPDGFVDMPEEEVIRLLEDMGFDPEEASAMFKEVNHVLIGSLDPEDMVQREAYWAAIEDKGGKEATRWLSTAIHLGDDKLDFIEDMDMADVNVLAYMRYNLDLGEMEARLTQALSRLTQKEVETIGITPHALMGAMQNTGLWRMLRHMYPQSIEKMSRAAPIEDAITDASRAKIEERGLIPERVDLPEATGRGEAGSASSPTDGPLFGRERNTVTTNRSRGGMDGGSLDSGTRPDDAWKNRPEGTQQQGTLEELFGEANPGKEWPQAHYSDFEGLLTPEMAADALLNPKAGTPNGAVREAARKLLFGDPMKYRTPDEVMDALERRTK